MAAGSTYTPIATYTIPSATANYTFSAIPSTYTDLVLIVNPFATVTNMNLRFNGDTGSNYSTTFLYADGTIIATSRGGNNTVLAGTVSSGWETLRFHIMNYSSTATNKTTMCRQDDTNTGGYLGASTGLWRSTAAINSITILAGGGNLPAGTMLTLYGITAA